MGPGQCVSLTHLAQIRGSGEPELALRRAADGLVLSDGDGEWHLPVHHRREGLGPRPPAAAAATSSLVSETVVSLAAPVTCVDPHPAGGVICGADDGALVALGADGSVLWLSNVAGSVYDIAAPIASHPIVLVGHAPAGLTALDEAGGLLWQRTIVREPCPWPWWELVTPAPVQVAGGVFAGETLYAVGCGDIQVRLYDSQGSQRWMWRYNEGVPGRVRIADVDGDGMPEIVVGGDILSDVSTCRILTHEGHVKAELGVEGWTSCLTALAWGTVHQRPLLACGATRGRNLHLYDLGDIGQDRAARPHHLFERCLGGSVTGLGLHAAAAALVAGTSQGFLLCFDLDGGLRWCRLLEGGITGMVPWGGGFLVQQRDGQCRLVSVAGDDVAVRSDGPAWRCSCLTPQALWFASGCEVRRVAVHAG